MPSPRKVQLVVSYAGMIALNIIATSVFGKSATLGYAHSYLQPDGPTFSIWGLIYTLLALLCIFGADAPVFSGLHNTLTLAFMLNGSWLIANGLAVDNNLSYWAAVFILFAYCASLAKVYYHLQVDYVSPETSVKTKLLCFLPISVNLVWSILASLVNFTNTAMPGGENVDFTLAKNRCLVGGPDWAMGAALLAALIVAYIVVTRADFGLAFGGAWALGGIVRAQSGGAKDFPHPPNAQLHDLALGLVVILLGLGALAFGRFVAIATNTNAKAAPAGAGETAQDAQD